MADSRQATFMAAVPVATPIAERVRPHVTLIALLSLGHFVIDLMFLHVTGPLAFVVLGLMGVTLVSTFTVSVVLGQQYLPRNPGMASGLIVGFATGTAGVGVTVLGSIADTHGLLTALWISALMPIAGFIAAAFLPRPHATA